MCNVPIPISIPASLRYAFDVTFATPTVHLMSSRFYPSDGYGSDGMIQLSSVDKVNAEEMQDQASKYVVRKSPVLISVLQLKTRLKSVPFWRNFAEFCLVVCICLYPQ